MKKTILLPTDFSKNAENALKYAKCIFNGMDVNYTLVHSWDLPHTHSSMLISLKDTLKNDANREMKIWIDKIEENKPGEVNSFVEMGSVVPYIIKVSNEIIPDFIVMGTKGASGLKKIIMGSNASAVIQKAPCTVIAVPENTIPAVPKKIVWASALNKPKDYACLKEVISFAKLYNAEVVVAKLLNEESETLLKLEELKSAVNENYDKIQLKYLVVNNALKGIMQLIELEKPDVLAIGNEKKGSFLEKLGEPNVAGKIAFEIKIPLMVLPGKEIKSLT